MRINLEDYYILSRIFLGKNLIITFQNMTDIHSRRVLELIEIEGFIDQSTTDELKTLRLDEEGGSYPHDLSLRLKRPEIMKFPGFTFLQIKMKYILILELAPEIFIFGNGWKLMFG